MPKLMNVARIASGVLLTGGDAAPTDLSGFFNKYILSAATELNTALIAVVGGLLGAFIGFLTIKYGLPIALQWIRKLVRQ